MTGTAYRMAIGDIKCIIFSDGYLQDPDGQFGLNIIYIEAGRRKILIDSGCGEMFQGTAGKLLKNMAAEGIKPADITDIIFSHAHIDHVCGTFDPGGKPVFPNARLIIDKKEWEYILGGPGDNETLKWLFEPACKYLVPLGDRFDSVGDNYRICPGLKTIPAPGHTPGSVMVEISSKGKKLLCIGDIIHAHLEFTEPEHFANLDINPVAAVQTRRNVLAKAAKDGTFIFATHFAFPGLGHIRENNGVLSWEPI